jgi:hypothetical protein
VSHLAVEALKTSHKSKLTIAGELGKTSPKSARVRGTPKNFGDGGGGYIRGGEGVY